MCAYAHIWTCCKVNSDQPSAAGVGTRVAFEYYVFARRWSEQKYVRAKQYRPNSSCPRHPSILATHPKHNQPLQNTSPNLLRDRPPSPCTPHTLETEPPASRSMRTAQNQASDRRVATTPTNHRLLLLTLPCRSTLAPAPSGVAPKLAVRTVHPRSCAGTVLY